MRNLHEINDISKELKLRVVQVCEYIGRPRILIFPKKNPWVWYDFTSSCPLPPSNKNGWGRISLDELNSYSNINLLDITRYDVYISEGLKVEVMDG